MIECNIGVHFFLVSTDFSGQRIDNFLRVYLKAVPKSMIYRIIRTGQVRVNKKRVKFQYKLRIGDILKIPSVKNVKVRQFFTCSLKEIDFLKNTVLYEDDYLLALNKPSRIAVHAGGSKLKFNIIDGLRLLYAKNQFLELVHRLDQDTSGILLVAKNRVVLTHLHKQLRLRYMRKEYLAVVYGSWRSDIISIAVPLIKKKYGRFGYMVCTDSQCGKFSETFFQIQENFGNFATLLKIISITGRTHQIRVHTKFMRHPIIGDWVYGNYQINTQFQKLGLNRLLLHASTLCFIHPNTQEQLNIYAPVDQEFNRCLLFLRKNEVI